MLKPFSAHGPLKKRKRWKDRFPMGHSLPAPPRLLEFHKIKPSAFTLDYCPSSIHVLSHPIGNRSLSPITQFPNESNSCLSELLRASNENICHSLTKKLKILCVNRQYPQQTMQQINSIMLQPQGSLSMLLSVLSILLEILSIADQRGIFQKYNVCIDGKKKKSPLEEPLTTHRMQDKLGTTAAS